MPRMTVEFTSHVVITREGDDPVERTAHYRVDYHDDRTVVSARRMAQPAWGMVVNVMGPDRRLVDRLLSPVIDDLRGSAVPS